MASVGATGRHARVNGGDELAEIPATVLDKALGALVP